MVTGVKIDAKKGEEDKFRELVTVSYLPNKVPTAIQASLNLNLQKMALGHQIAQIKDLQPSGTAIFTSEEIAGRLNIFGLPEDSPLSVLIVEVFGNITNIFDHIDLMGLIRDNATPEMEKMAEAAGRGRKPEVNSNSVTRPLSRSLGHYRILRTSPLTKVPFICCPTCE